MFDPSIPASEGSANNYLLASIIGKRAKQIQRGSKKLTDCNTENAITISICEYKENKLEYKSKNIAIPIKIVKTKSSSEDQ